MAGVAGSLACARPPRRADTRARSGCLGAPFCRWQAPPPRGAVAASRALREGACAARLKQAPPIAVLAALPSPVAYFPSCSDRCGDVALSRAGPKPRQTRDGHSWRMGPLFSLCLRAPRLSRPPDGGVWRAGVRNPARPRSPPPPASRRRRGQGSPDAADTLRPASAVSSRCGSPRGGEGRPAAAPCAPRPVLWWCPWSDPGRPSGARGRVGGVVSRSRRPRRVIPLKGVRAGARVGEVEGGRGIPPLRPARGEAVGASSCALRPCSRPAFGARLGRAPCRVSPSPRRGGRCGAGGRGGPGPVNFRPLAGCEGCAARSRYSWTTASFALVSLCAPCSRLRPPFAEAVVRLPLPVPQTPTRPRRRRPSALAVPDGECPGPGAMPPSVRKPSLAIRRGCLGVPHPPAAAPRLRVSFRPASFARGRLRSVWRRAPERCSPAYRGPRLPPPSRGRVTHGPGAGRPRRGFAAASWLGRVRRVTARGVEVCGAGAAPPPASPRRAALRPLPSPSRAAAGGRRAGTGRGRLVRGGSFPGAAGSSRAATGRLGEREKTEGRWGGFPPRRHEVRAGAPGGGGPGQRPGSREGWPRPVGVPGVAGPPSCVAVGSPRDFPAARLRPRPFPGVLRAPAPSRRGLPPCARPPPRRGRFRPFASGGLTEAGLPPRGCRPRPLHRGGRWLPRRGAPRTRRRGGGGSARARVRGSARGRGSVAVAAAGPELPREARSLGGGDGASRLPGCRGTAFVARRGPRR